jgi:hypothetical protein
LGVSKAKPGLGLYGFLKFGGTHRPKAMSQATGLIHEEDPLTGVFRKLPIIVSCDFDLSMLFEPGAHNFASVHIYRSSYKFKVHKPNLHATQHIKATYKHLDPYLRFSKLLISRSKHRCRDNGLKELTTRTMITKVSL